VVTTSVGGIAHIWDAETGKLIAALVGHQGPVLSATFSPDGSRIVTASLDKTARIWDGVNGREIAVLHGHGGPLSSATFSPDGTRILTASGDLITAALIANNPLRIWSLDMLRYSDKNTGDETARIWDAHLATMPAPSIIEEVCSRRLSGFTALSRDEMLCAKIN
jgi:WD40 repeat protein